MVQRTTIVVADRFSHNCGAMQIARPFHIRHRSRFTTPRRGACTSLLPSSQSAPSIPGFRRWCSLIVIPSQRFCAARAWPERSRRRPGRAVRDGVGDVSHLLRHNIRAIGSLPHETAPLPGFNRSCSRQNAIILWRLSVFSSEHDTVSCRHHTCRGVAQPGRAPGSGPGGRRFKSSLPDHSFSRSLSMLGGFSDFRFVLYFRYIRYH